MFTEIHPKLPMRSKNTTQKFYENLGFHNLGSEDFEAYLMMKKDKIEIHFFEFKDLNPLENYGQIYIRTTKIKELYEDFQKREIEIHPNGKLQLKPWMQLEFSILDPDNNLITFGESVY